jgi:ATP-binding cassette subfamily F protein uup
MTFKDRHALEALPTRIAALQQEVVRLTALLADPDLYARDPARFAATTRALAAAQEAVTAAEEQWLTLEMLREEIEG